MSTAIGLQLYSVREQLKQDFAGIIRQIAEMGYTGIETAGFPDGIEPKEAKKIFDEHGLTVISSHSSLPLGDEQAEILNTLTTIGCPHLVSPWMDPDYYTSTRKIKKLAELFNQAFSVAKARDMEFSIHNHTFEFSLLNGRPAIYTLVEYINPEIKFQLDTYWIQVAGLNPVEIIEDFGPRAPLLHIKDGPATEGGDMVAISDGVIDVPAIIKAGEPHTKWWIVELDRCATDMLQAIEKSYRYLSSLT